MFPEESVESILWVFSLTMLMNRGTGPLNGYFLSKTSHRTACCLGLVIMTASMASFGYLPKVAYMYPAYGVAFGWASGLITLSAFTAYGPYFDKKRAISVGITGSGSGLGTIIIPIILRTLFDYYSFTGAMLIFSGVAVQMLALACLLRPFSFYENLAARTNKKREQLLDSTTEPVSEQQGLTNNNELHVEEQFRKRSQSAIVRPPKSNPEQENFNSTPDNLQAVATNNNNDYVLNVTRKELAYSYQDISDSVSAFNLVNDYEDKEESNEDCEQPSKMAKTGGFNWRLAYHPKCIVLGLAIMTYSSGMAVAYYSIPPLGRDTDVSKKLVATLLTVAGGIEIPFRIFNGWLADKRYTSAYTQMAINMLLVGIGAIVCGAVSGVAGIVVMIICCSTVGTSVYSLMPITAGELLGQENMSVATSMLFVYHGSASIISTFSAGAIVESTGRWEYVFFYIGACMIFASCILTVAALVFRLIERRKSGRSKPNLEKLDAQQ